MSPKQISPKDSGASNSPGNLELDHSSVSWSARKLVRDNDQDPTTHSQEWQQDHNPFWGTRKLVRSGDIASSVQTTSAYAHTRTFSRCARSHAPCDHMFGSRLDDLFVCLKCHFIIGHVFVECSFNPRFLPFSYHLLPHRRH